MVFLCIFILAIEQRSFYIVPCVLFNYFNYCRFYLSNLYMINFCVLLYQSSLWLQNVHKFRLPSV